MRRLDEQTFFNQVTLNSNATLCASFAQAERAHSERLPLFPLEKDVLWESSIQSNH